MNESSLNYLKGDLFKWGNQISCFNACVGGNGGPYNYHDYCRGYFFAARTMAEKVLRTKRNIDISIYPLFYLYRHAIELGLKHVYFCIEHVEDQEHSVICGHDLKKLWCRLYSKMENIKIIEKETLLFFDKVISDIATLDANSETFRFPESKSTDLYLQGQSHINIFVLEKTMKKVENVFEYWFFSFARILENRE